MRHGETTHSVGRRLAGWSNPPLTEAGRGEAIALRGVLDGGAFDSVWSSDLDRTVTTARLAFGEPRQDMRLREVNFGLLEDRSYHEVDLEFAEVFLRFRDFEVPGGETHREFSGRVHGFVAGLPAGRHLLFVHGGVIRVLTQDLGLDRFVATGSVVAVDWSGRRVLRIHEPGVKEFPTAGRAFSQS